VWSAIAIFNLQLIQIQGEHIDYALFGVLPAAIDRDILIACAPRPPECHAEPCRTVVVENLHPKYTRHVFEPVATRSRSNSDSSVNKTWSLDINTKELRWESYVKAGYYVRLTLVLRKDSSDDRYRRASLTIISQAKLIPQCPPISS